MKKSLTVRLEPELIEAAKSCAAREHRSLTNFIEASLLARIDGVASKAVRSHQPSPSQHERSTRGE